MKNPDLVCQNSNVVAFADYTGGDTNLYVRSVDTMTGVTLNGKYPIGNGNV